MKNIQNSQNKGIKDSVNVNSFNDNRFCPFKLVNNVENFIYFLVLTVHPETNFYFAYFIQVNVVNRIDLVIANFKNF